MPDTPNRPEEQKQVYRRAGGPANAGKAPRRQPGRAHLLPPAPPAPGVPPTPQSPKAPRPAPTRQQLAQQRRLLVLVALGLLALLICLVVWLLRDTGPRAPAELDIGEPAAAWAKNENGFYFNDVGEAILPAVQKGIDVSRHQGEVDWQKAKDAGIDFAILRCGFGGEWTDDSPTYNQDDVQWRRNADACTELGIPFGVYLYSYALNVEDARSEADHAARLLGLCEPPREGLESYTDTPYKLSLPFYYDLEDGSIAGLFPAEMAEITAAFFDQLESYGYKGEQGIYASVNWVRGRLQDPGFDKWRDNFWIARYAPALGYTGPYRMWQSTYQEPGAAYGVQSETVDVDFLMETLSFTGIEKAKGDPAPAFSNDTYTDTLWLAAKNDRAALITDQLSEKNGGQRVFWQSSDETVATVDRRGAVQAVGDGTCTVTATLADGRLTADCTVRVGDVTVPILATGALAGRYGTDAESGFTLADAAAYKKDLDGAVLLDVGNSVQGTLPAALTGGRDMMTALNYAGYDLQAVGGQDLAFGIARLLADTARAQGPTLAANLHTADGVPMFYRAPAWSNCRLSNGMHTLLQRAGHSIGFFALTGGEAFAPYAVPNEAAPTADDLIRIAGEQVAALAAQGAEATVCVLAPPMAAADRTALQKALAELGVTAVIDGCLAPEETFDAALPTLAAAGGTEQLGRLDLCFTAEGKVTATTQAVPAAALVAGRERLGEAAKATYANVLDALASLEGDETASLDVVLFTLSPDPDAETDPIPFDAFVAESWRDIAEADRAAWAAAAGDAPLWALACGTGTVAEGDVTCGDLLAALPAGERLQLVLTTAGACQQLVDGGAVLPWLDQLALADTADPDAPAVLITDTAALRTIDAENYTLLRDYGDVYWRLRMLISDATNAFNDEFHLPAQPSLGAGRGR